MDDKAWRAVDALIAERDPYCRGVLVLGLNAPIAELAAGFRAARASRSCRGFAVGRTIFGDASRQWLSGDIDDATLKSSVRERFESLIGAWRNARYTGARP
jgi:5-dehydro-2-deoxygluconokinase